MAAGRNSEESPFLPVYDVESCDLVLLSKEEPSKEAPKESRWQNASNNLKTATPYALSFLVILQMVIIYVMAASAWAAGDALLPIVYSPAQNIREPQTVRFDGSVHTDNAFKGPPSAGLDNAWKELYDVDPLLVTQTELNKIEKTSVEVPSRPGYHLAKLAVFHQLHCLDKIRKYVHNDYYRMTDAGQTVSVIDHVDHCIDIVRQSLMCHADTSLITFKEGKNPFSPVDPDFEATHSCTNFEKVHSWAKEKSVNMTEEVHRNPHPFKDALVAEIDKKIQEKQQ